MGRSAPAVVAPVFPVFSSKCQVLHGRLDSLVGVGQARAFVEKLKRVSDSSVVYAELPGAQHAFDVFPSIRSAHIVRAIDRYLHWHWTTWREGLDHEDEMTDVSQAL